MRRRDIAADLIGFFIWVTGLYVFVIVGGVLSWIL